MSRTLPALAVLGLLLAAGAVVVGEQSQGPVSTASPVPTPPYTAWVAGAGILEASTLNVAIGVPITGVVARVHVTWGEKVSPGDPLLSLDDRDLMAQLVTAQASVEVAHATLTKAEHAAEFLQDQRELVSTRDVVSARDVVAVARAELGLAEARVAEIHSGIELRTIRAPVAGRILRLDVAAGVLAPASPATSPLLVLGDDDRLHVRVDVDQHEAWRVRAGARAVAFPRGNPTLSIPLEFVRIEPFVQAKTTLTGLPTERTDERVLQVVYGFQRGDLPVYAGQAMDVFIEAQPPGT